MESFRRTSRASSDHDIATRELGKLSDIMEMPCPHADLILRLWERGLALYERMDENFETCSPQGWTVNTRQVYLPGLKFLKKRPKFDMIISLVARPDKPGHPGTARVLNPQWIEPSIPRAWYDTCLKEHGQECHKPAWMWLRPEPIAMPEWLVDVIDNCVVPCNSDTARYTALSYTWGGVQCLRHTSTTLERLKTRGSLHPYLAPDIPQTVRDAFEITKLLGERYLWIDSLCIDQDETITSKGLNSMHHIYANSIICLIALAGTSANHGLRGFQGISAPRHIEQHIFNIADGERVSWFTEPKWMLDDEQQFYKHEPSAVEGSGYNERGWTYQENLFARRRLFFTDTLLRWTCECAAWGEESYEKLKVVHPPSASGISTYWMDDAGPDLSIIRFLAANFSSRYLTYEADTLRAFLGVQNHISRDFLCWMSYGHPEMFFDISLLWRVWGRKKFGPKRRLSGAADSDPPSWSWMGWQGFFIFDEDREFLLQERDSHAVGYTQSVAQWYTMPFPLAYASDMRPVKCRWQICKTAVEAGSTHIPVGWEKVANGQDRSRHYYRRVLDQQGTNDHLGSRPSYSKWKVKKFKYPVPLPPSTVGIKPIEQQPFIFAKTTRSFFVAKSLMGLFLRPYIDDTELRLGLFCRDGECAGLLQLNSATDVRCSPVELVAVVKGWTTSFFQYFLTFRGRKEPGGGYPFIRGGRLTRHSCYFVLCVEWEDGVAKRQGTGMVEADIWERNCEPVDLILG